MFSCRWVHANTGVRKDKMGFTLVDLKKGGYNDEPFIMAVQDLEVNGLFIDMIHSRTLWPLLIHASIPAW